LTEKLSDKSKNFDFSGQIGILLKNEAQRRSWAKVCKVIWEIPS
jgi:hypothetical protein